MRKYIDIDFEIGETVYLKTDSEQDQWIVVEIRINFSGVYVYLISRGIRTEWVYPMEISTEKSFVTT